MNDHIKRESEKYYNELGDVIVIVLDITMAKWQERMDFPKVVVEFEENMKKDGKN